jgi:hypothetical protein
MKFEIIREHHIPKPWAEDAEFQSIRNAIEHVKRTKAYQTSKAKEADQ